MEGRRRRYTKKLIARGTELRDAYELAVVLKQPNVGKMLQQIQAPKWVMWRVFQSVSPQGAERDDIRAASITQSIWNVQLAKTKNPTFRTLDDMRVWFGDAKPTRAAGPTRKMSGSQIFDNIVLMLKKFGAKPKTPGAE